jgi:Rrf2 family transcriptional regulator, cysteine metabolism repressor
MRLTTRSEYGLLALIYLAKQSDNPYVAVSVIAEAQDIPAKFLEQILLTLKRGGYVSSKKGKEGGYRLAQEAAKITLSDIVRMLDGPLAPTDSVSKNFYRETPVAKEEKLVSVLTKVRDSVLAIMDNTTLADLV